MEECIIIEVKYTVIKPKVIPPLSHNIRSYYNQDVSISVVVILNIMGRRQYYFWVKHCIFHFNYDTFFHLFVYTFNLSCFLRLQYL